MHCLQLAVRYFNQRFGISTSWNVAYAAQMCSSFPAGVSVTGSPQHGDLAVFSWAPYGHVAVISGVYPDGSIDVWEQVSWVQALMCCEPTRPLVQTGELTHPHGVCSLQNSSPTGTNTYPSGEASCYLTAGGGGGGGCPAEDGYYCGDDGLGMDANTLYKCQGGTVVGSTPCGGACEIFPSGTNDECVGGSCRCGWLGVPRVGLAGTHGACMGWGLLWRPPLALDAASGSMHMLPFGTAAVKSPALFAATTVSAATRLPSTSAMAAAASHLARTA
jgi:surface antigen